MVDFFVPIVLGDTDMASLFRVIFQLLEHPKSGDEQKNNNNNSSLWDYPDIPGSDQPYDDFLSSSQDLIAIYDNIERYLTDNFKKTMRASVYLPSIDPDALNTIPKLSNHMVSVLLGIFLAAAEKITGWNVKGCWKSITATGTFNKEPCAEQNLLLENIDLYKIKFDGFKKDFKKIKCSSGKKHLYIYINDDKSLEKESNDEIEVKAFSIKENSVLDILDFVFDLPTFLPDNYIDDEQKKFFIDFEEKTKHLRKEKLIEAPFYTSNSFSGNLNKNSLFIHGPNGCGKSFLAMQIARRLIWDRKIYAPIWININNDQLTEAGIQSKTVSNKDNAKLLNLPEEISAQLLSFFDNIHDENSFCQKISEKQYLIIIDGLNLPDNLLDDLMLRMEKLRIAVEKNGSRIIFTGKQSHSKSFLKNIISVSMPEFEKDAVISFFHDFSKNKENYNSIINQMAKSYTYNREETDLNFVNNILYKNYGNYPHLLEIISNLLFFRNFDYKDIILSINSTSKGNLEKKAAILHKYLFDNPDTHKKFKEETQWLLLYLLNYSPDKFITLAKLTKDIDAIIDKDNKDAEDARKKLKKIFASENTINNVLYILNSCGFIQTDNDSIKIFDTLTYRILRFEDCFSQDNLRELLVSEKPVLSESVFYISSYEYISSDDAYHDLEQKKLLYTDKITGCNIFHGIARFCPNIDILENLYKLCPQLLFIDDGSGARPVTDNLGQTALHYAAASNPNPKIIEWLLREAEDFGIIDYLYYKSNTGNIALHYAAEFNPEPNIIKTLLYYNEESIARGANSKNEEGLTPLMYSVWSNPNPEIINEIIDALCATFGCGAERGADISEIMKIKADKQQNLLHFCVYKPDTDMEIVKQKIKIIREYAKDALFRELLDDTEFNGQTPLHYAASYISDKTILNEFIVSSSDPNKETMEGVTAMHLAVLFNISDTVKYLADNGIKINKPDWKGWTPLHYAVMDNQYDKVYLLKSLGADLNFKDKQNFTPLHIAVETGKPREFIELLATTENINEPVDEQFYNSTPLILAVSYLTNAKEKSMVIKENVSALIKCGARIDIPDNQGQMPLHYAAVSCDDLSVIQKLISLKTLNYFNKQGFTPLAIVPDSKHETIDFLIKAGAKI